MKPGNAREWIKALATSAKTSEPTVLRLLRDIELVKEMLLIIYRLSR
jgi:hypothetical protein